LEKKRQPSERRIEEDLTKRLSSSINGREQPGKKRNGEGGESI